jgi:hypothetical protein
MELSSLPAYPERAGTSRLAYRESVALPRTDRLVVTLFKLAAICCILAVGFSLRWRVLEARPPEPVQVYGEWESIGRGSWGLKFSDNGEYQETVHGNIVLSGSFHASGHSIRVFDIRDKDGGPKLRVIDHTEASMEELRFEVDRKENRLAITNRDEEWRSVSNGEPVYPLGTHQDVVYKRRTSPPADPAIAQPIGVNP